MHGWYQCKLCIGPSRIYSHRCVIVDGSTEKVMVAIVLICLGEWASYQIHKIAGCAYAGNAGNVFPRRRFKRKPLVSDTGMHHGTCVTHVPWCMSGSLTCGDGENVPGIPGACAPAILRIWQEAHTTLPMLPWPIQETMREPVSTKQVSKLRINNNIPQNTIVLITNAWIRYTFWTQCPFIFMLSPFRHLLYIRVQKPGLIFMASFHFQLIYNGDGLASLLLHNGLASDHW